MEGPPAKGHEGSGAWHDGVINNWCMQRSPLPGKFLR